MLTRRKSPGEASRVAPTAREVGLRLRERWLRRALPKQAPLLRYARALLAGVFELPALRGDAPGVPGLRRGEGFARCARALGLPIPVTVQRGRTLVACLMVAPRRDWLDFYVVPQADYGRVQVEKVKERVRRISGFLEARALQARFQVIDAPADARPYLQVATSGALLAGAAPADFWSTAQAQAAALGGQGLLALARELPTALGQWLAVLALGPTLAPAPFLSPALDAATFADVERAFGAWARPEFQGLAQRLLQAAGSAPQPVPWPAQRSGHPDARSTAPTQEIPVVSFEAVMALAEPAGQGAGVAITAPWPALAVVRRAAEQAPPPAPPAPAPAEELWPGFAQLARPAPPAPSAPTHDWERPDEPSPWPGLEALARAQVEGVAAVPPLDLSRLLVAAAWRSLRRVPLAERSAWRELLEGLGCGREVPQPLRKAVLAALQGRAALTLSAPRRKGEIFQVTDPQAGCWAQAGSPERALACALAAIASCAPGPAARFVEDPQWKLLAARLVARAPKRVSLALMGEGFVLLACLRPGRRPNLQRLPREAGLRRILVELERGRAVELLASGPAVAHELALWSRAVSAAPRFAGKGERLAVAHDGHLVSAFEGEAATHRLTFALWRPRRLAFLTGGAFDDRQRPAQVAGLETLRCAIGLEGGDALLHYRDPRGDELQERVPLEHLRSHLADVEALLLALPRRAALSVRPSPELSQREASLTLFSGPTVSAELQGALPHGLQLRLDGALYGARAPWSWSDAALTVLSRWQVGVVGRVSIAKVNLAQAGGAVAPLLALYARSAALRRLALRIAPRVGLKPPRERAELSLAR